MSLFIKRGNICWFLVGPASFRPRSHTGAVYSSSVEKGRPVLQGLLAIDFLAKEACFNFFYYDYACGCVVIICFLEM